jgi:hypothetical protein
MSSTNLATLCWGFPLTLEQAKALFPRLNQDFDAIQAVLAGQGLTLVSGGRDNTNTYVLAPTESVCETFRAREEITLPVFDPTWHDRLAQVEGLPPVRPGWFILQLNI